MRRSAQWPKMVASKLGVGKQKLLLAVLAKMNCRLPLELALAEKYELLYR